MGTRTISASLYDTVTCQHEDSAYFESSSFDSAVSNEKCVGGEVTFSDFRGWGKSYYFIVYINGEKAFETREINDQNSSTHKLTTYIDTSTTINSSLILQSNSGDIRVKVIDNTSPYTDDVCSFRSGCEITIKASHEPNISRCERPSSVTVGASSTMNGTVSLSWFGASAGVNNSISGYQVDYADSSDNSSWGGWTTLGTYTSSPQNVATPAVGKYRKYRVWTLGAAGSSYNSSSARESSGSVLRLQTVTRCTAPATVTVEKTITAAAENKLSWKGAKGGTNNSISGYFIQYMDSADGKTWNGTWGGDITVGAVNEYPVPMPAENTYRKFRVYTLGNAGSNWRSSSATESAVTFRGHAELEGFTDAPLVVGETHVKALHMQELQDRANTLRDFYRLSAYNFTPITAGVTGLKDWTAHVNEIRAAVDEITTDHAAWLEIPVNCPRADVIEQLRAVILAI